MTQTPLRPGHPAATLAGRRLNGSEGRLPTRNRPTGYVALAIALIVGFAALGYWMYANAGAKVPVVMAASDIAVGQTVQRSDLTTVEVAGGVTAVAASHIDSLVGQTAAVEILPNTLVQRAMLTSRSSLSATEAIVGVAVAPDQVPSSGLRAGDRVEVIGLPPKGTATTTPQDGTLLAGSVTVYDVRPNPSVVGGALLSLIVARSVAPSIAAASSAGTVAVVRVSG